MRHDELKTLIEDKFKFHTGLHDAQIVNALYRVVELHKPNEADFPDEWESCVACSGNNYEAMYPCQTIGVIEKELL
jgi:hypothetical protein